MVYQVLALSLYLHDRVRKITVQPRTGGAIRAFFAAQFPSQMHGVQLVHRFAASHHFKGPHDAYGKDAKHLCRTAERNQKARLPSTHDVYYFCATKLPRPRRASTAKEIVGGLPDVPPPPPLSAAESAG